MSYVQGALGVSASSGNALSNVTDVIGTYDFNGDGRSDILYNLSGTLHVAFASGSGFQAGQSTGLAVTSSDRYDVADVVGSGRNDIFITRSGVWHRYYWTGSGFAGVPANVNWYASAGPDHMELADYNGDGLPDLITVTTQTVPGYGSQYYAGWVRVRLNTSSNGNVSFSGNEATLQTPACTLTVGCYPHVLAPRPWSQPRDLNADGRPDLLLGVQSIGFNRVESRYYSLVANGTTYDVTYSPTYLNSIGYLKWNDDRCADVVTTDGNIVIAACDGLPAQTLAFSGAPVGVVDWNADGRIDLLVKNGSILSVYPSTGAGLGTRIDTSISAADKVFPLEVDGDGLPDLLIASGTSPYNVTYRLHNDVGSLADHLSAVTDGYGVTTSVSYVSITAGHYTRGSGPAPAEGEEDWLAPYWVVGSVTSSDGIGGTYTQTFDYAGARRDRLRGFAGFQMKQVTDSRTLQVRRTHYDTVFPRTGMVRKEELFKPGGSVLISSVDMSNTHLQLSDTQYAQRYFPYASVITSKTYDLADTTSSQEPLVVRTVEMLDPPDNFGNFGRINETLTDRDTDSPFYNQLWTTLTTTSFTPDPANWCVSQPTGVTVAKTAPGQPTITRRVSYGVDYANCRASTETIEPGSSYELMRTFGFDAFGNVNSELVSGTNVPSRTTLTSWDTTGQFPETITDPIGSTANYRRRIGYDYVKGVRTSEVIESLDGAVRNAPETSWTFDEFGRVTRETRPDSTSTLWTYADCTAGCFNSNHRVTVTMTSHDANGVPISDQSTYLDRLARPLVTREKLLDGTYNQIERQYDVLGRLQRQSVPCSAGGCTLYWITNSYDDINRLTQVTRPIKDNIPTLQSTIIQYSGRTTIVTDAQLKVSRKTYDVAGLLRRSEDHTGYVQSFTYDSFGSVTSITDSASRTLFSATYDYGVGAFQRTRIDRSLGSSSSTYNALGELQTHTDAKNQTFAMTYDALSRPVTRRDRVTGETTQESKTVWTWGQSVTLHNVGHLQGVSFDSTDGTYTEAHTYDGFARASQRDISMPGQGTFTYNFGYDAATGLVDTLTYPVSTASARLTVRYCYQYGHLQKVAEATCSGAAFWQANATNSRGQITNETLGNGITTQRTFDAVTGWVSTVMSGTAGSPASVQNESYLFDRVGNVTQRQNNRVGLTEDFYYDDLYRLDYSSLTNGSGTTQNLDMTYQDAFGNIQSKMEAGYTAPPVDQTIEWTAFNYPKRITATVLGGTEQIASFNYGPDRQRWRMVYQSGSATETTLYIGGLMERVTVGTATDYRHYIYAGGRVAAIFSRHSSGTNTLRYVLQDHQGSVASLLTGSNAVNESFTAYGNRRDANTWSNPPSAADLQSMHGITRQGYTGHTALGTMGLNHMNGRVQDAITGTFLSPDPYVNQPGNSQGFNRYAYAHNNPLTFIDPTGFDIYCWMPPSSYGGTHFVTGPDGRLIEGPVAEGSRGQCVHITNTPGPPPGGPGGGGGGGGGGAPKQGVGPLEEVVVEKRDPCAVPVFPPGESVDKNIKDALAERRRSLTRPAPHYSGPAVSITSRLDYFYNRVHNSGIWDYKQLDQQYIPAGNFNFGATGTALGIPSWMLHRGAGAAQKIAGSSDPAFGNPFGGAPYGDDPDDQLWIDRGMEYFNSKCSAP
jgi:RHS repeat-associated protein